MKRKIIQINEEKCNGCGLCASACHEGAIGMVQGKAKLLREDYCDGLGDCLPACPTGAIQIIEREAAAYDEAAVREHQKKMHGVGGGCPGSRASLIHREPEQPRGTKPVAESQLRQWPVQIKLVPVRAPYFNGAKLLIAADCTAFSFGDFHERFMWDHITVIGCPKLDQGDYTEKLTEILRQNDIKSVTVVRMEVPCCGGLAQCAVEALKNSGKMIPWRVVILSTDGHVIEE